VTLREYIEQLTMKLEQHGDAQCYYAEDERDELDNPKKIIVIN
jgi:hypothetical protein